MITPEQREEFRQRIQDVGINRFFYSFSNKSVAILLDALEEAEAERDVLIDKLVELTCPQGEKCFSEDEDDKSICVKHWLEWTKQQVEHEKTDQKL